MKGYWKARLLSVLAGAVLAAAAGSMSAQAAPAVMKDGQIFDAEYYAAHNPDVAAAVGTDAKALYQHYESAGKAEGRAPYDPTKSAAEIVKEAQEELKKQANIWEMNHGGFSGRCAQQFIDYLAGESGDRT